MADGDTARLYHRLSSYGPEREYEPPPANHPLVVQDFVPNDVASWPTSTKRYPDGLVVVKLPRAWPVPPTAATAVLAGRPAPVRSPLDLATLARLLHLSAGVVRTSEREGRPTLLFRAAGSAGGRFPLELYVSARGVERLVDGVHWYDPVEHALVQVGPAAAGDATTLIVTGIPWRTCWRYRERGFRHVYWDAGTMLAQTLALADSAGLGPDLRTRFPDAEVSRLVGADGVQEIPLALVTLGGGAPAIRPTGEAATAILDVAAVEFPLITQIQHAGDLDELGHPWLAAPPLDGESPGSTDLDIVILQRGSTRLMDRTATVDRAAFDFSMAASLRGTRVPHFVAVHAVDRVEPGLYRWPNLDEPIRRGTLREELLWVCWDMDLARDAAFVVMSAVDLDTLDDHGYREAQLDAGIVEGRLHLAAYAMGIGASGLTFLDSEIEDLLGAPFAGLLFTCVGVPTYRNTAGGRPGQPVPIVMPVAGETLAERPRRSLDRSLRDQRSRRARIDARRIGIGAQRYE